MDGYIFSLFSTNVSLQLLEMGFLGFPYYVFIIFMWFFVSIHVKIYFILFFLQTTVSESSIFDHLINIWEFNPGPIPGTCDVHFLVDFKFQSPLYRQVMFFGEFFIVILIHLMLCKLLSHACYCFFCFSFFMNDLVLPVIL